VQLVSGKSTVEVSISFAIPERSSSCKIGWNLSTSDQTVYDEYFTLLQKLLGDSGLYHTHFTQLVNET
jgi:hypothetical protein